MKDWQLLLLAAGIIAIEVAYTIPLLVLIHINGDTGAVIDESRPPFTNVSITDVKLDSGIIILQLILGSNSMYSYLYLVSKTWSILL